VDPRARRSTRITYPESLEDLIELCRYDAFGDLEAAGSHWALSPAAISTETFIETHDFRDVREAMGKTLKDVVLHCLHPGTAVADGQPRLAPPPRLRLWTVC